MVIKSESLLANAQDGFHPDRSCATQLMMVIEEWSRMLGKGEPVNVMYLDLAKAFTQYRQGSSLP